MRSWTHRKVEVEMSAGWKRGWREAWIRRRNSWLSDPAFHRFAWAFPLFRSISRTRAQGLFGLVTGFTFSQLIAAGVEIGLFQALQQGPLTAAEVGETADLSPQAATDLLEGLSSIGMVERLPGGRYALGVHGAAFVADPGLDAMVRHNQLFYADLADPLALLRTRGGGKVAAYWPYAQGRPEGAVEAYSELMAASQPAVAEAVIAAFDFADVRTLMDVGGGEGAFIEAVHRARPGLGLMLFDLPQVAARAQARVGAYARVHGGIAPTDLLPTGADCISLVRVVHDHDDDMILALFGRIYAALPKGGRILIAEPMAGPTGAGALGDVYFRLYMRAMGRGRPRTAAELMEMLRSRGFGRLQQIPTRNPFAAQLVTGRRDT
jgi:demethylspheroidene O-methyltransferase